MLKGEQRCGPFHSLAGACKGCAPLHYATITITVTPNENVRQSQVVNLAAGWIMKEHPGLVLNSRQRKLLKVYMLIENKKDTKLSAN